MRKRPLDARGYPVPWFVQWIDGRPDFRVMDRRKWQLAMDKRRCWLCGEALGKYATFVVGLMCLVNHTSAEPPSHMDCAKYAVKGCPFLTIPTAQYREANRPADACTNPGAIMDNPEVSALWTCDNWEAFPVMGADGVPSQLVWFGDPKGVQFWTRGRPALSAEVWDTFRRRIHILQDAANEEGGDAPDRLAKCMDDALFWLPTEER